MFERYTLTISQDSFKKRFSVDVPLNYKARYNAAPTQLLPVITSGSAGVSWFYWGRSPSSAKNRSLSEKIVNLQAETLIERPVLKRSLMRHRCIVPADGFYCWKKVGKKTSIPHRCVVTDQDAFSFPAIWEEFENAEGETEHTFTVITHPSNSIIQNITERMPVILNESAELIWLSNESSEADLMAVIREYPPDKFNLYTVSPRINDTRVDVPSLITHTPPSDQHGNLTLFN
jgi:putative SOS response-associated peptidase YedK